MLTLRQVLLLSNVLLLALVAYQLSASVPVGSTVDVVQSLAGRSRIPEYRPPRLVSVSSPLYAYREMIQRPLFSQSRRPQPRATVAEVKASPLNLNHFPWELNGVTIRGKDKAVLIWHKNLRKSFTLKERDSKEGWTIKEIQTDYVVMQNKTNVVELNLRGPVQLAK